MTAARKVAEILDQYGLSLEEVEAMRDRRSADGDATRMSVVARFLEMDACVMAVSAYCDCQGWSHGTSPGFTFFGLEQDAFAAATLFQIIDDAMGVMWEDYRLHKRRLPIGWQQDPVMSAQLQSAFLGAMGDRVATRLRDQKAEFMRHAVARNALVVAKSAIVARGMEVQGIKLVPGTARARSHDTHASLAGAFAGARVDLASPHRVRRDE